MATKRPKISTGGGSPLLNTPFAALSISTQPIAATPVEAGSEAARGKGAVEKCVVRRGEVHLRIEKAGRRGKTVTVVFGEGVKRLSAADRERLLRSLKTSFGTGGTSAGIDEIEVNGDERPRIAEWLRRAGFTCKG
ncbi:MAG: translation initiation factor [Puniceicoccales bacterium]|jgi:translation initiation factor 1|nr:translation initiation factor [Puniceicoccales bacterium]